MRRPTSRSRGFRLGLVVLGVLAASVVLGVLYAADARNAEQAARDRLFVLLELRRSALEEYLRTIRSEVVLWSERGSVAETLDELTTAWRSSDGQPAERFRRLYVDDNPYPAAEREELADAGDGSLYSSVHAVLHPQGSWFREHHGYYDVLLVDAAGNLVYSVTKEEDFGTNLLDGPWAGTGLGRVVQESLAAEEPGVVAFADFEPYGPSDGEPASFISSPVFDDDGRRLGVLAFQIPTERVDDILQFAEGLGRTGEIYAVAEDHLMQSDSRFEEEGERLETEIETTSVDEALAGNSGVRTETNYHGAEVLAAFGPLTFEGQKWAVIAEIERGEILASVRRPRRAAAKALLALSLAGALVCMVFMVQLGREGRPSPWREA